MVPTPTSSQEQFDAHAANYAASAVHRSGPSLPVLVALAAPTPQDRALDVATGTGHTALALAPHVGQIVGVDIATKMLEQARLAASERGAANAEFVEGPAEALPFPDGWATLVTSRHAPHHFHDVAAFLAEVRRVLAPGGRFVMSDQISPSAEVSAWTDRWERLRDPSHFVQRTRDEWHALCGEAGLVWGEERIVPYRLDFAWWVRQSGCSDETVALLREHARAASDEVRRALGLEFDSEGEVVAHHEPMLVVRMERP